MKRILGGSLVLFVAVAGITYLHNHQKWKKFEGEVRST